MKTSIALLFAVTTLAIISGCTGCSLRQQMPKATITFNPKTHEIEIASGKDIVLSNVVAKFEGTNASISIGYYRAAYNVDVVRASVEAQQQQIKGLLDAGSTVIKAAIEGAK